MDLFEVKNLSYQLEGRSILQDITFKVEEGAFLAVTGPSGSGKSTLLKILATLLSKTGGEIFYAGRAIETCDPIQYRREVSYCFQTPVLFGTTVRDNLAFPYEIRKMPFDTKKAVRYLESVGLPGSYLDKNITTLSGGEKQRIALIRNVLLQPRVLLLDEVTSALDETNRHIIWRWLESIRDTKAMTILMVSHNEEEAALAEASLHIVEGKIMRKAGE